MNNMSVNTFINMDYGYTRNTCGLIPIGSNSISNENPFVPVNALFTGTKITKGNNSYLIYNFFIGDGDGEERFTIKKYNEAINHMNRGENVIYLKTTRNTEQYQIQKGIVSWVDENMEVTPLIVLMVKSDYIFNIEKDKLDYSKFCILVNNKIKLDKHLLFYKNMKKQYLDVCEELNIDIVYTNNVENWISKTPSYIPKFKTIPEMLNHLKDINKIVFEYEDKKEESSPGTGGSRFTLIDDTINIF